MTTEPAAWIDPFADAGADAIIICFDSTDDPGAVLAAIKARGLQTGVSLLLEEEIDLLDPHWEQLDILTLLQTPSKSFSIPLTWQSMTISPWNSRAIMLESDARTKPPRASGPSKKSATHNGTQVHELTVRHRCIRSTTQRHARNICP